jgi:ferrous iron transport protein A
LRFSLNNTAVEQLFETTMAPGGRDVLLPLELLSCGEWADVVELYGDPAWVSRLAELGVRVGCRLRVLQPGKPCLLQIGSVRLSLRSDLATQVLVRPVEVNGACRPASAHAKTA